MAVGYPLINGVKYDFSSIEIDMGSDGGIVTGISEISYSHGLEPGEARGTHPQILARTRGTYSAEGSITMYKAEYATWIASMGDGYQEKSFDITVVYSEPDGDGTVTDVLYGCRMGVTENSASSGTDPLSVTVPIMPAYIVENGTKPLSNMIGV
jgi:hypothetical protein